MSVRAAAEKTCVRLLNGPFMPYVFRRQLYEHFIQVATPEQLERFEHWKRSKFPREKMRRLMSEMIGSSTERGAIVLVRAWPTRVALACTPRLLATPDRSAELLVACAQAAISKMFVGELVESAREKMTEAGEVGPIPPSQLRQAYARAQRAGTVPPSSRHSPRLFWRRDSGA